MDCPQDAQLRRRASGRLLHIQGDRQTSRAATVIDEAIGFDHSLDEFETHARRLLAHVDLRAIAWVNISMKQVTFTTLTQ